MPVSNIYSLLRGLWEVAEAVKRGANGWRDAGFGQCVMQYDWIQQQGFGRQQGFVYIKQCIKLATATPNIVLTRYVLLLPSLLLSL